MFFKIAVLKNFANFTGKHLCWSLFLHKVAGLRPATLLKKRLHKVAGLRPATLLKKRLQHRSFPVKFAKFIRTPFFTKHLCWLILYGFFVSPRSPYSEHAY